MSRDTTIITATSIGSYGVSVPCIRWILFEAPFQRTHAVRFRHHQHPRKEASMRFYTDQHLYYCGVDLHARSIYACVLDQAGQKVLTGRSRPSPIPSSG